MGGELEHYTKNSDPFSLLAPEGNSCLPMRQSPGKTTPRWSAALHLILHPRHAPGAVEGDFSLTLLHLLHLPPPLTLHSVTSHPKSHRVQRPGGLMKHRRHFWTVLTSRQWWPALLFPSPEKRAALILAVSHPLDNHFHGRSRSEAEDTQDYISQWEQPCRKNMSQGMLC